MTEPFNIKAIYTVAADILQESGLCKGSYGDMLHEGPVCVATAILLAAGRTERDLPSARYADSALTPPCL